MLCLIGGLSGHVIAAFSKQSALEHVAGQLEVPAYRAALQWLGKGGGVVCAVCLEGSLHHGMLLASWDCLTNLAALLGNLHGCMLRISWNCPTKLAAFQQGVSWRHVMD